MRINLFFIALIILNLAGCATAKQKAEEPQVQQLQARVGELEEAVQQKDAEIYELKEVLKPQAQAEGGIAAGTRAAPAKLSNRQIQKALQKAGFYDGPIDGIAGKKTKKAIRDFQGANGLTQDGIVGKKTIAALARYLD